MPRPASELRRVQFVSKPMVAPFRDGSKCLVRDLCLHLRGYEPHVMTTGEPVPELGDRAVPHRAYSEAGKFSPGLRQNAQAAWFVLAKTRADVWHFVFAPNKKSSGVGRMLRKLRRVPTVQTIASPPRTFGAPGALLFGDVAVAQSEWTRAQFLAALEDSHAERRIEVIPPPAPELGEIEAERSKKARARLGLSQDQPLFVYPGDLEVSDGAARVVDWASELASRLPGAQLLIAYRDKTPRAEECAAALKEQANLDVVRFECNVVDIHGLVAASTAILFPVDDLFGKVDLPIVLLEALRLGTPVLALDAGPLSSLQGALLLSEEPSEWLDAAERLVTDDQWTKERVSAGRAAVEEHYAPAKVAAKYEKIYDQLLRH